MEERFPYEKEIYEYLKQIEDGIVIQETVKCISDPHGSGYEKLLRTRNLETGVSLYSYMYTAVLTPWLQKDLYDSPRVYQNKILKFKPVYKVVLHENRVDRIMQEMLDYQNCHNQGMDLGEFDV